MDNLRTTGRTTRMIDEAKKLSAEGRAVYVITANEQERQRIAKLFGNDNPYDNGYYVRVETPYTPGNFDWETCSLLRAHPNCIVLIDHFAVEEEISRRLSGLGKAMMEMHKYDSAQPKDTEKIVHIPPKSSKKVVIVDEDKYTKLKQRNAELVEACEEVLYNIDWISPKEDEVYKKVKQALSTNKE